MDIGRDQQLIRVAKPKRDHSGIWVRLIVLVLIASALAYGYTALTNSGALSDSGSPPASERITSDEAGFSYSPAPSAVGETTPDQSEAAPVDASSPPNSESPQ